MSAGLATLSSLIQSSSTDLFRSLRPEFFTEDEGPAYLFFTDYQRRYGAFPTLDVMAENGFPLPMPSGTTQYHRDLLQNRLMYNIWMGEAESFHSLVMAGQMSQARDNLETILSRWRTVEVVRDTFTMTDAIDLVVADYQEAVRLRGRMRGVSYGWDVLDEKTGGCRPGDVATIVARPGQGKTFSILKMATTTWAAGEPIVVVSMEMNAVEIARRVIAMGTGVNADFIQRGNLSEWGEATMMEAVDAARDMPPFHLLIGNLSKSVRDVDMMIQEHAPTGVYLDAGYLINPTLYRPGAKRFEMAADTIREIKDLAMSRNKPIIQTVQFNRQQKADEEMSLDNIGGTDEIGQISSLVLGMKRGLAPNENVQRRFRVIKNRHGEDGWEFSTNFRHSPFDMSYIEDEATPFDPEMDYDGTQGDAPPQVEWQQ